MACMFCREQTCCSSLCGLPFLQFFYSISVMIISLGDGGYWEVDSVGQIPSFLCIVPLIWFDHYMYLMNVTVMLTDWLSWNIQNRSKTLKHNQTCELSRLSQRNSSFSDLAIGKQNLINSCSIDKNLLGAIKMVIRFLIIL